MTQNIYDDPAFFKGYSQLGRSVDGLAGAAEWPALRAMLPDMHGLRVVDLGCGFGWFCRGAREQGAAHVLGIDASENMLARARSATADTAITYERADLESLGLPDSMFDLAYSSLALHYIQDIAGLFAAVHRALVPGGHLIFSIEDPIYMAPTHPEWSIDAHGHKIWPLDRYSVEGPRTTNWLADGVAHGRAALCLWMEMLELQWHPDQRFGRMAIAAAASSICANLAAQFDVDIGRAHGWTLSSPRVGSRWPRHLRSTAA